MPLPGAHNRSNAEAAISAALAAGIEPSVIPGGLRSFRGLPHRLERIAEVQGRQFYNDSLATTPESAICALQAFAGRVLLLAGGYDKHVDLTPLAYAAAEKCEVIAWMGQTASSLNQAAVLHASTLGKPTPSWRVTSSLQEALHWCWQNSRPGDVILLSPGCASFDWFQNFADRGDQFRRLVSELAATNVSGL